MSIPIETIIKKTNLRHINGDSLIYTPDQYKSKIEMEDGLTGLSAHHQTRTRPKPWIVQSNEGLFLVYIPSANINID